MPLCASSKRPFFCCTAPVKAPRSWPNSSLSTSVAGSAPQFTFTITLAPPAADAMDRARDQLLARAGLAEQQHRRVGVGHELDGAEHLLHRRRAAQDLAEVEVRVEGLAQVDVLALQLVGALAVGDVARDEDDVRRGPGSAATARSGPRTTAPPTARRGRTPRSALRRSRPSAAPSPSRSAATGRAGRRGTAAEHLARLPGTAAADSR